MSSDTTIIDIKTAAKALNERPKSLDFDISVADDDFHSESISNKELKKENNTNTLLKDIPIHSISDNVHKRKEPLPQPTGICSCLSLAYYQPYFDVDTIDIQQRITRALLPFKKNPSFLDIILNASNPDAYGPFWISATLIFTISSCSNIASWIDYIGDIKTWSYDFTRLVKSFTLIYSFASGLPFILWTFGKYMNIPMNLSFLLCLYGYSLTIFIPATIICVLPNEGLDWIVLLITMAWSLFFFLQNLWKFISQYLSNEKLLPLLCFIGSSHLLLVILIKMLFF